MTENIYCLKCKCRTNGSEAVREGKFEKCICLECGGKKSRIVRVLTGSGIEMSQYAKFARLAYEPVGSRGAMEDLKLSTAETAVFAGGDTVVVAFRGTTPSSRDIVADARITIGTFLEGSRFKRSVAKVQEVQKKYPDKNIILTGSSLGGRLSHDIGILMGLRSYSFNIGSSPVDIPKNIIESLRCKFTTDEEHKKACESIKDKNKAYSTFGDVVSLSSITGHHDTEIIPVKKGLNPHNIDNFITDE